MLGTFESTLNNIGCLVEYNTSASSTSWWTGVWGANTNEFNTCYVYKGLSIKPTGDVSISGNLDVGVGASHSTIKAHVDHVGYTGYIGLEARWNTQGYMNFETTSPGTSYLFLAIKSDPYLYCGDDKVYMYKGYLDIGPSQAQNIINTYLNHDGSTGNMMMEGRYKDQGYLHFETNYQYGELFLTVRHHYIFYQM